MLADGLGKRGLTDRKTGEVLFLDGHPRFYLAINQKVFLDRFVK